MKDVTPSRLGRKLLFWLAFASLSLLLALGGILALDLYLHSKFDATAGVNYRGYRGKIVGEKQAGELRLVVLGGSTAYGYGVRPEESFPAFLERELRERLSSPVTVVNLAYNNQGAYSFRPTLEDYAYLEYDGVILYEGYNDLSVADGKLLPPNTSLFRHDSPIFRILGYYPIFPTVFREKAMVVRNGGDLEAAYRGNKTVFRPGLAASTQAGALEAAVKVTEALEAQLKTPSRPSAGPELQSLGSECGRWAFYCGSVRSAVDYALSKGKSVLVVTQPYIAELHVDQQEKLAGLIRSRYASEPRVARADLGKVIDLKDSSLAYDGMHLYAKGNEIIAEHLVDPVLSLVGQRHSKESLNQ